MFRNPLRILDAGFLASPCCLEILFNSPHLAQKFFTVLEKFFQRKFSRANAPLNYLNLVGRIHSWSQNPYVGLDYIF